MEHNIVTLSYHCSCEMIQLARRFERVCEMLPDDQVAEAIAAFIKADKILTSIEYVPVLPSRGQRPLHLET